MMANPKGQRGSWFAEHQGRKLPCVHKHWMTTSGGYCDPGVRLGEGVWDEFIAAIAAGKVVILTSDEVSPGATAFKRTGYIATFRVDQVRVSDGALRFEFVERLDDF